MNGSQGSSPGVHRMVCLANSRLGTVRCVAGKFLTPNGFGSWVRPVSWLDQGGLSNFARQYQGQVEPNLLDVVEFSIVESKPSGHQSENRLVEDGKKFKKVGSVKGSELLKVVDKPLNLWTTGHSSGHGTNDFVPKGKISEATNSLYLLNPISLLVEVSEIIKNYKEKVTVRGKFTFLGAEYNLSITDPVLEDKYVAKGLGEYVIDDVLLTVSLAHTLFVPSKNPQSSGYYKVIAGVIDLAELGS